HPRKGRTAHGRRLIGKRGAECRGTRRQRNGRGRHAIGVVTAAGKDGAAVARGVVDVHGAHRAYRRAAGGVLVRYFLDAVVAVVSNDNRRLDGIATAILCIDRFQRFVAVGVVAETVGQCNRTAADSDDLSQASHLATGFVAVRQRGSGVGAGARDRPIAGFLGHQTRVGVVAVGVRGSTLVDVALHLAEVVVRPALRVAVGVRFVNQVAIDVVSVRGRFTERCGAGQHPVLAVVGVGDGVFGGIRGVAILQVGTADAAIGGHAVAMGIEHIGFLRHLAARGTAGVELEVALPRHLVEVVVGGVGDVAERAGGGLHGWGFGGDRAPQGVVGRIGPSPRAILRHGLVAGGIVGVLRNVVVLVRAEHQLAVDVVVPGLGWRGPDVGTRGRHRKHVGLGFPNLVVLAVVLVGRHVAVGIRGGGHIAPTVVGEALTGAVLA